MVHKYVFGEGLVAHSAHPIDGVPTIILGHKVDNPEGTSGEQFLAGEDTVIIQMSTPDAAFAVIEMVFQAITNAAIAHGMDPDAMVMPVVSAEDHNRRVQDLLEANNRYLERARAAELLLFDTLKKLKTPKYTLDELLAQDRMTLPELEAQKAAS